MHEEQDTCRICSAPGEPDQPLFYPCKCSGTIRYIHQDCLTTWLAHSKKKTCDVCKYPYSFTKVYSPNMPKRLPPILLMRQLSGQALSAALFGIRAMLVGSIWLAFLPWVTIWTWRAYFAVGETFAWWISARPRPHPPGRNYTLMSSNSTESANRTSSLAAPSHEPLQASVLTHPLVRTVTSDIVAGQIIASLIVLTFVAVFLLREWISQNARPGVFEDADVLPDAEEQLPPLEPDVNAQPRLQAPLEPPRPQGLDYAGLRESAKQEEEGRKRYGTDYYDDGQPRIRKKPRRASDAPEPEWLQVASAARKGKAPERAQPDERQGRADVDEHNDATEGMRGSRRRRRLPSADSTVYGGSDADEQFMRSPSARTIRHWRKRARREQQEHEARMARLDLDPHPGMQVDGFITGSSRVTLDVGSGAAYDVPEQELDTYVAVPSSPSTDEASLLAEPPSPQSLPSSLQEDASESQLTPSLVSNATADGETVDTPDSPQSDTSSRPLFDSTFSFIGSSDINDAPSQPATPLVETPGSLRRPPLPSVTLLPSSSSSSIIAVPSRGRTPLASPHLATYRAPEDLQAGPSGLGYFDGTADGIDGPMPFRDDVPAAAAMDAEHRRYFREADDDADDEGSAETHGEHDGEFMDESVQWSGDEGHDGEDGEEGEDLGVLEHVQPEEPLAREEGGVNAANGGPEPAAGEQQNRQVDQNDEAEANLEDDMDAAFEAIGLRGPFYAVLQNAALMIVILDTSIGLGIFVPFLIGKITVLLSLDPKRFLQIVHLPLRLIRLVTDPVVDFAMMLISQLVVSPIVWAMGATCRATLHFLSLLISESRVNQLVEKSGILYKVGLDASLRLKDQAVELLSTKASNGPTEASSLFDTLLQSDAPVLRVIEPYFAPIGHNVRVGSKEAVSIWIRFALGNGPNEKAFAVVLGYAIISLLLALYLNILTVGSVKSAGRAVRSAVRQQLLVLKVAIFIMIELVVFPLGCGVMLDICSVWLLQQGTLRTRAEFLVFAPLTAIFYHWVIGTMFMYQFAVALAGCRRIMRPGAMWFIKDPQDQNFHPIRDILERPALVQIRKLLMSALMYGVVVAVGVGTVSALLRLFSRTIMPFRWKIREPLSPVPVDLVFIHIILPYTLQYFRPKKVLRQVGGYIWKWLAHQLRLTSYMFGGRHPSEEFTPKHWSWRVVFATKPEIELDDAEALRDGSFRRVPNSDNIMLVKNSPATAEVTEDGAPIDERAELLIAAQDSETEKAKRSIKDDYTIVYIPPRFRYRITTFVVCIWIIAAVILASVLAMPVLIGRHFFKLFTSSDVHDGYSFIAGFYLLWACWIAASALDRLDKRRQRLARREPRAEWPLYIAKRALLWIAKTSYMIATLGVIIPALIGLVIELYIIYPIRHTLNPAMEPRIRIVDQWALGLIYIKIILRVLRMQRGGVMMRGIERIRRNGWTHPDPIRATKEVIAPVAVGLLGMVVLPAAALWGMRKVLPLPLESDALLVHVYPGIFTVAGLAHALVALSRLVATWSQSIRDKEFLVEMRLRNLEPDLEQEPKSEIDQGEEDEGEEVVEEEDEQ
ncbi:hypothetical protein OBBRIDRAFT_816012 [Obba rivulosa]|uniref:RING-type E3 ubiquitin transferase n=1 Tax=Obba rivulosa TaxID=1052685 RepID=A0A8E2DVF9_9APHY|nr:hypothetical protein OBBRIDRAFT_816012 [Obba rivulosa]